MHHYKRLVVMIFVLMLLTACGSVEQTKSTKENSKGNTEGSTPEELDYYRVGFWDSGFLSPFTFNQDGPGGFLLNTFIFDSLTWKDDSGVIPLLAEDWAISDDGLTYTFDLRENVNWHDGEPVTVSDAVFSYEYFAKHPYNWKGDLSMVESISAESESSFSIKLKYPYAPFITDVAGIIPIIPEHIWKDVDEPMNYTESDALIGTGPYEVDTYEQDKGNYLFEANEAYFLGKPRIKKLAIINEDGSMAVKNDKVDATMTWNFNEVKEMEEADFDVMESKPTGSAVRLLFNLEHQDIQNKELRQAITYALDRESLATKSLGGNPIVGNAGIIPPDSKWYNEDVKQYDYNIDKANELLDQSGYEKNADGMRDALELSILISPFEEKEAKLMQSMLEKVGIELEIKQVDVATFTSLLGENTYDLALTSHIGFSGDPDYLRVWFLGEASNTYAARGKALDNEKFQELAEKQVTILDEEERKQYIDEMQDILAEELPTLVLFHRPFYWLYDESEYNGWYNTDGGIADGIPLWMNKAAFIGENKE